MNTQDAYTHTHTRHIHAHTHAAERKKKNISLIKWKRICATCSNWVQKRRTNNGCVPPAAHLSGHSPLIPPFMCSPHVCHVLRALHKHRRHRLVPDFSVLLSCCCCCWGFFLNSSTVALFEPEQSVCGRWWWWQWRRWWWWWVSNVRMSPESGDCDWFLILCQWCSACSISAHLTAPVTGCVSSHIYIFFSLPTSSFFFALMQAEPGCNLLNSHHRCLRATSLRSDQKSCFFYLSWCPWVVAEASEGARRDATKYINVWMNNHSWGKNKGKKANEANNNQNNE